MSVDMAHCVELNQDVYINEARMAFHAQNQHAEFNFVCTDPSCIQPNGQRTQMTALYYQLPPEETTIKKPTFRHYPGQPHTAECVWTREKNDTSLPKQEDETEQEYKQREIRRKLDDVVEVFIRPKDASDLFAAIDKKKEKQNNNKNVHHNAHVPQKSETHKFRTTGILDTLVTFYLHSKQKMLDGLITKDEFEQLTLKVKNENSYCYREFFKPFDLAWSQSGFNGVYIGQAINAFVSNLGFGLFFLEKINNKSVALYVKTEQMKEYRYKNNLLNIIREKKEDGIIMAYFMNPQFIEHKDMIEITIPDPRHISLKQLIFCR